jgi:hypothetical protein
MLALAKSSPLTIRTAAVATGSYVASSSFRCQTGRIVTLLVSVDAAAIANQVSYIPVGGFYDAAANDVVTWYALPSSDGAVTEIDLTNPVAGTNITGQNFGSQTVRGLELRSPAADSATERQRLAIHVNPGCFNVLRVWVRQLDGGSAPTVTLAAMQAA